MPAWLKDAVFYEIYPQSFMDSNGDGIGDFGGIEEKLSYLQELGVNAIWMNPCFDSSFFDAGYDVRDYYKTAPRYGTNDDLKHLFDEVHKRGMHILLDLVPGHTAIDHPWFVQSCKDEQNEYTDRYIWRAGGPWGTQYERIAAFLCGYAERPGAFAVNCFCTQPALNYGFARVEEPWQFHADSDEAHKTRLMMQDVMKFWLDMGCDGFRVDMAGSLVKEDPDKKYTIKLWQKVRSYLDEFYPDAALVSEWGNPLQALEAGFHMDFLLHNGQSPYMDLFRTKPYFSSSEKTGDLTAFVTYYNKAYQSTCEKGLICIPSGNHDMTRMRQTLTEEEMKLAFTFLMTMPGCPFIYYGDEIGMRFVHGLKSKEGGYDRTGSRTPMQWSKEPCAGFSTAMPEDLYLPLDPDPDRPDVSAQQDCEGSLWNYIHSLIEFRLRHSALTSDAPFRFLSDGSGYPLAYERWSDDERLRVIINPSSDTAYHDLYPDESSKVWDAEYSLVFSYCTAATDSVRLSENRLELPPGSCAVLRNVAKTQECDYDIAQLPWSDDGRIYVSRRLGM